ncbi:MAG TPA: hypothetical protein VFT31_15495 [Kribbella sp.]|nr:hypothetical protein [Kribbella sp.]
MSETERPDWLSKAEPGPGGFRRRWLLAVLLVVAVGGAAGGLAWRDADSSTPAAVVSSTSPTAEQIDVAAQSAAVDAILRRRADAVLHRDGVKFLADVDPRNPLLRARQKVLFANLVQFGFARLTYRQDRTQFEQALVDKHGPSVYLVGVVMTYQISGINAQPVRTMLGYTFVRRAGRLLLIDDDHLDKALPAGSHREAWDTGPVLVRRAPRVLVVVEHGRKQLAASILADAQAAVRAVSRRWPTGWQGSGVVIALDDRHVRDADYTKPKDAEDILAIATQVYRTLPGEVENAGESGGSYVVVNPRYRNELDARSLAHEFTHVATAPYGAYAPRWLVEGTAAYIEMLPMDGERDLDLEQYRRLVRSKYLTKAGALPADDVFYETMRSSYSIGWYAVDYLFDKHGAAKVAKLYKELARQGFSQTQRDLIMTEQLGRTEAQLFVELNRR